MNTSGWLLDYGVRAWTSGPMPYPSRAEVLELADKTAKQDAQTAKQLEAIDMRQAQSIERGAIVADSLRALQIISLKTQITDAEADLLKNPMSESARKLIADLRTQLEAAEAMALRTQ